MRNAERFWFVAIMQLGVALPLAVLFSIVRWEWLRRLLPKEMNEEM